jgi:regulator of sigma E protease
MSILVNILVFAAVMSIIVVVHEFGHLVAAKSFGVYCREFAIGMGPKVYSYQSKKSETAYSVRLLPIGGFVAMAGEPGEEGMDHVDASRTINGIARWKRLIILFAGVIMNLVLAFVVFFGIFLSNGILEEPKPIIADIVEGYPAEQAGLMANDEIIKMTFKNNNIIYPKTFTEASTAIRSFEGSPIKMEIKRGTEVLEVVLTPVLNPDNNTFAVGIYAQPAQMIKVGLTETFMYTFTYIGTTIVTILTVLKWALQSVGLNNFGSPIAIFQETSKVAGSGMAMLYFWNLIGSLSISLAVMNLVPIPIFDGGRALLTVIEMIIRRPIPKKLENAVMMIGFVMVMALMILLVMNDIKKL